MRKALILFFFLLCITVLSFQNCAKVNFTDVPSNDLITPKGDDPICVTGKKLGIWLDSNNDGSTDQETYLGDIVAYSGNLDAASNYNYYSASAHPIVGPTPNNFASHVFFYEGPDGLSMSFYFNVDESGSEYNAVDWNIRVSNNDLKDTILISDEPGELTELPAQEEYKDYEGRFQYWLNTDGGVIGPLEGEDFKVQVEVLQTGDIQDATFYSANGELFSLLDNNNQVSSFIIQFLEYEDCQ